MTQLIIAGSLLPDGAFSPPPGGGFTTWQIGQTSFYAGNVENGNGRIHPLTFIYQPEEGASITVYENGVEMTALVGTWEVPADATGVATTTRPTARVQLWDGVDRMPEGTNTYTMSISTGQAAGWGVLFLRSDNYQPFTPLGANFLGSGLMDVKWISGHSDTFGNEILPETLAITNTTGSPFIASGVMWIAFAAPVLNLEGVDTVYEVPPSDTPTTTETITLDPLEDDVRDPYVGWGAYSETNDEQVSIIKYGILRDGGGGDAEQIGSFGGYMDYESGKECYLIFGANNPNTIADSFLFQNTADSFVIGTHDPVRVGALYQAVREQKITGIRVHAPLTTAGSRNFGFTFVENVVAGLNNEFDPLVEYPFTLGGGWQEGANVIALDEADYITWPADDTTFPGGTALVVWYEIGLDEWFRVWNSGITVPSAPFASAGFMLATPFAPLAGVWSYPHSDPGNPDRWYFYDLGLSYNAEQFAVWPLACEPLGPDSRHPGGLSIIFPATDQGGVQNVPMYPSPLRNIFNDLNLPGTDPTAAYTQFGILRPYSGAQTVWDTSAISPIDAIKTFRVEGTLSEDGFWFNHYLNTPVEDPAFYWSSQITVATGNVTSGFLAAIVDSHDTQPWWLGTHDEKLDMVLSDAAGLGIPNAGRGTGYGSPPDWSENVVPGAGYEELGSGSGPGLNSSMALGTSTIPFPWGRWMYSGADEFGIQGHRAFTEDGDPVLPTCQQRSVPWGILGISTRGTFDGGNVNTYVQVIG